ncbi:MAG: cheY 5 [Proteobacteria bacterium]|nr:cheY 5 [Pseudomonadota bacterium]
MLNLRALIVDDSTVVRSQLRNEIKEISGDFHIFECESVLEAGRFLLRSVPDVLFLDLNMPNINGIELLKKFDSVLGGRRPPIVVSISTDMRPATLEALKARGAYALLPKPFDRAKVALMLLRIVKMVQSRRVLIVDDSATVRTVVKRIIEHSRFKLDIEEAANGADAIRLFRSGGFDLAFIDVEMPGIDGLEAAGEILYSAGDAHVVLMSGKDDEPIRRAASHIGVEFFLKKPFYAKDVDEVLHSLYAVAETEFVSGREPDVFEEPETHVLYVS